MAYKTWAKETEQADLPALAGGRPVREVYLPLNEPYLTREEISEATAVIESGRFSAGARVQEFEERFAERVGARYAVAVSTCTAALHAACYAAGISRGEEVIMSPLAPPAAGSAVIYIGAKPVFADVNEASLNLDPAEIERNITHNTRAIVVTHFAGHPCDIAGVLEVARRHQLVLVEDATEALGAAYRGQPVGSFGLTAAFSLNP
ncbi:MAG TPA: UDP-4-amino-4,6-dideoxy-N-acetyl-beta-L-altrosamine transaminase, partial [Desulfotomaculum sp.]|nr:UDP-4-amino-4,6-dideoxy-N-acetyl-beta-L-altrosamine transaminase [Desulfotomaculum sp.]